MYVGKIIDEKVYKLVQTNRVYTYEIHKKQGYVTIRVSFIKDPSSRVKMNYAQVVMPKEQYDQLSVRRVNVIFAQLKPHITEQGQTLEYVNGEVSTKMN